MRRWLLTLSLLLVPAPGYAQSQVPSIKDIISLSQAGLADDVILALIEVNRSVYPTDADTLKGLKNAGVSPAVIVAMVKSGRQPLPAELDAGGAQEPPEPVKAIPPQVVVVERDAPEARTVYEAVPVPVYVTVPTYRSRHHRIDRTPVEPVYWGFGGTLRPDAWKPTAADVQKDARIPPAQKK